MARLETLRKRQQRGLLPTDEWLDTLAHRAVDRLYTEEIQRSENVVLTVELPAWDVPIVYGEPEPASELLPLAVTQPAPDTHVERPWILPSLFTINDLDASSENLVEAKHRRLVRSQRLDAMDRERKPTAAVRDELHVCQPYLPLDPFVVSTYARANIRRNGPDLVVPLLPHTPFICPHQVCQVGRLVRCPGS